MDRMSRDTKIIIALFFFLWACFTAAAWIFLSVFAEMLK